MMAFMATILAHGVATASRSGYSARPDRSDHDAYGIGHILYSRSTSVGKRDETGGTPHTGHPPDGTLPRRRRGSAPGTGGGASARGPENGIEAAVERPWRPRRR
ncbi:hypothetical protein TNCT6_13660 [Streptomyces sp. 6-11-2]|nr:hypothetical protein TNCT6_13660 [Streptomyces sp. 6-11-2]